METVKQIEYNGTLYDIQDAESQKNLVYSQEETDTGKIWIDGKKIYRKVIKYNVTTSGVSVVSDFDTSVIETVINIYGSLKKANLNITPLQYYASDKDGCFIVVENAVDKRFKIINKQNAIGELTFIAEYTKTTN